MSRERGAASDSKNPDPYYYSKVKVLSHFDKDHPDWMIHYINMCFVIFYFDMMP